MERASPAETPPKAEARQGPRPLPLHLSLSILTWMSSRAALPIWRQGLPALKPAAKKAPLAARQAALAAEVASRPLEELTAALDLEINRRAEAFGSAVESYRRHPYRRDMAPAEVLWQEGSTRLIDYRDFVTPDPAGPAAGIPLLVVPSLINRAYVLDLSRETSLLRWLAARGVRPLLIDWGRPGIEERGFGLEDYIVGRLGRALDEACAAAGQPVQALGYCMGGLLALGAALQQHRQLRALALLATPWDFHAGGESQAALLASAYPALLPAMTFAGELPADAVQALFTALDPLLVLRKFLAFGRLDPESARARQFVALEDWLNDGVPLTTSVAKECLLSWYGENQTARGGWLLAGKPVAPEALACPSFCVIPSQDRIVPPASAQALAAALPDCRLLQPSAGHIGMVASTRAPNLVWAPLLDWLRSQV